MISIIIPAYNEEEQIGGLLAYLKDHIPGDEAEILVVDGGSTDATRSIAKRAGAKVLNSPSKGRANQLNYGVENAHGDWLYFLHADTWPPTTFLRDIRKKREEGFDFGCFLLSFDWHHPALRLYSWFTRFDIDVFRFGDQSLFVKKSLFKRVNGFDENLKVMEDQEIIKRLKVYAQFGLIKKSVTTSARKYEHFGAFRLQCIFSIIVVLFYLRISQEVIAHFYKTFMEGSSC